LLTSFLYCNRTAARNNSRGSSGWCGKKASALPQRSLVDTYIQNTGRRVRLSFLG
jgi:hypothetical protein